MIKEENYKVYLHTFPNGKMYVGITRQNVEDRWQNGYGYKKQPIYSEILKYGWDNIKHEVLFTNLDKNNAQIKEKELIQKYNTINNGYNISIGGSCGSDCWCEFEYDGIVYTAKELAEMSKYDLTYHDITTRINCHKWTIEKALNIPKQKRGYKFEYNGKMLTLKELYKVRINRDLTYNQIRTRILKYKWDIERALTQPNNKKKQPKGSGACLFEYNGEKYNSYQLCLLSPLDDLLPQDITDRINRRGWSIERALTQPKRKRQI